MPLLSRVRCCLASRHLLAGLRFYRSLRAPRRRRITISGVRNRSGDPIPPPTRIGGMGSVHPRMGHAARPRFGAVTLPLLTAGAFLLLGCGSSGDGTDRSSADTPAVTIRDYLYEPASI